MVDYLEATSVQTWPLWTATLGAHMYNGIATPGRSTHQLDQSDSLAHCYSRIFASNVTRQLIVNRCVNNFNAEYDSLSIKYC